MCSFAILFWLFGALCNSPGIGEIRLANSKESSRFDLGGDCIESMGQSRMAMLLISIDILLAINNSKSWHLPRSISIPLGNVLYFSSHTSCMPLTKYTSVYYIVFPFLSQIVWDFYISVHVCEQKKSEFLPTWMLFVLSCSSYLTVAARASAEQWDVGKASSLHPGSPMLLPECPQPRPGQCLCAEGTSYKWDGRGAAWHCCVPARALWSCPRFVHWTLQFLHLHLWASHFLFAHLAFESEKPDLKWGRTWSPLKLLESLKVSVNPVLNICLNLPV